MGSPSPRAFHAMAYDERRGGVVLYGGHNVNTNATFGGFSLFTGTDWVPLPSGPPRLSGASLAPLPSPRDLHLFGGSTAAGNLINDLFSWNGTFSVLPGQRALELLAVPA